jgi:hypothetical protein
METTYTNLRVVEKRQSSDVYGTGDQIGYNVYQVVRDFDESDIYDKTYSRGRNVGQYFTADLLKSGCVIETVSTREFAHYIINGLENLKKIKRNAKTKN